jgi:hypothetical protein
VRSTPDRDLPAHGSRPQTPTTPRHPQQRPTSPG